MIIIEKYEGNKTYMYPNGALATPEQVLADFPACLTFPHIVETDEAGQIMWAMQNLSAMRSMEGIDSSLSEADAIAALQEKRNAVPEVDDSPSAEERIAAALEYQNLMGMDDAE
jgi:hypothetical protein